ncbi:MAG: cobalamin-dependent protein [Deltaproteobacteria bacterium]|nr:cobalamin-dependent protein [Deltaproteobacteria bacterium]MBN2686572.1 cobalamin-dependent protein [Deltaproteobacteria bacterium]
MANRKLRIMVAKPGLDGHDRGARVLARCFRDAGYETIYTGCHQTPEQIAAAAIQEDIDCVGLSCMSGAHKYLFPECVRQIRALGGDDIQIIGGGIIPKGDYQLLYDAGLKGIFTPGITLDDIVKWINENIVPNVKE